MLAVRSAIALPAASVANGFRSNAKALAQGDGTNDSNIGLLYNCVFLCRHTSSAVGSEARYRHYEAVAIGGRGKRLWIGEHDPVHALG
jgi:hypothetical protein